MQQSMDVQKNADSSKVMAAAASGFLEGFLQDKKDTLTMFGVLGYSVVLGIGLGLDYSYRKVDEKKEATKKAIEESKEVKEGLIYGI